MGQQIVRPLEDRIVVRPDSEAETFETTEGVTLYRPGTSRERPQQGVVIAVGPGIASDIMDYSSGVFSRKPFDIAVGNTVLYGKYSGVAVRLNGEEVLIMRASDVLAVLES